MSDTQPDGGSDTQPDGGSDTPGQGSDTPPAPAADDTAGGAQTARVDQSRLERATRVAAWSFGVAMLAGVALVVVYFTAGGTQAQGLLLFVAFGGIALGLGVWAKVLLDEPDVIEDRPRMRSTDEERRAFAETYADAATGTTADVEGSSTDRRGFLAKLLAGAGASLTLALLLPFRSLGETPGRELFRTAWRDGARLVSYEGEPLRPQDINVGAVETVFPEGEIGSGDAQALLIGVDPTRLNLGAEAPATLENLVCFSKVCTHAGCPVGLYRAQVGELLCPCHQSKFDVFDGAVPISGPTTRPLPQLPLGVDDQGFLVALGDFEGPVGPAFWNIELDDRESADER